MDFGDEMKQRVRVLHILDRLDFNSGVASVVKNYMKCLSDDYIFDLMVNAPPEKMIAGEFRENGGVIYEMPPLMLSSIESYILALDIFFSKHHYHLVHGHIPFASPFYMAAARRHNIPCRILHSHNVVAADGFFKKIRNSILKAFIPGTSNLFITCSSEAGRFLFGKKVAEDPHKMKIIPNAVEYEKYAYNQNIRDCIRTQLNAQNRFIIGHAGRMVTQKNHFFLLDIFEKILKQKPESLLVVVGDGPLSENVTEYALQKGIGESVRFLGTRNDLNQLYQAFDIFLLPSLYEGLPLVAVEAQASGLSCVLSDSITLETDITGNNLFLSLSLPPQKWAEKILSMKTVDRQWISARFSDSPFNLRHSAQILADYYKQLLINRGLQ